MIATWRTAPWSLILALIVSQPVDSFPVTTTFRNIHPHHAPIPAPQPRPPRPHTPLHSSNTSPPTPPSDISYPDRISPPPSSSHPHRSGFLSLIGAPNMGKSTLFNALLSQQLCTVTPRPQTTRHAILGVLTSENPSCPCQLCFRDTPGVIHDPAYRLQEGMMEAVKGAIVDSDVVVVVTDLYGTVIPDDELFRNVQKTTKPIVVVINKIDLADAKPTDKTDTNNNTNNNTKQIQLQKSLQIAKAIQRWRKLLPSAVAIVPLSASSGGSDPGVAALRTLLLGGPDVARAFRALGRPYEGMFPKGTATKGCVSDEVARALIPVGPPLYGMDHVTDRTERFFASEIIRAAIFNNYGKEIPYCCEVRIASFQEPKNPTTTDRRPVTKIAADICVERDSQKGIVVGKGGSKIREVGVDARKELEEFLQCKVHLSLNVRVDKNWRKNEDKLRAYGYLK